MNTVDKSSLISQLDHAGISWKAYLQSLPYPGYEGMCYPSRCNGSPDVDPLYVSKHDGIQNFTTSRNAYDTVPQPGAKRDLLFGATALSSSDVWAVGEQQTTNGTFSTLIEHFDGSRWSAVPGANPGATGNHLYAVAARASGDVWAVGQRNGQTWPDSELILHWDGSEWQTVPTPSHGGASAALYGVSVAQVGGVWAVGETIDPARALGGEPLVERLPVPVTTC